MSTALTGEAPARRRTADLERHGIDYIPPSERHGKPNTLFTFWAASNVQILAVSVGAAGHRGFGLSLPWAIFAILVGNASSAGCSWPYTRSRGQARHAADDPVPGPVRDVRAALPNLVVVLIYIGFFTSSAILGGEARGQAAARDHRPGHRDHHAFMLLMAWFGYDLFHAFNRYVT